MGVWFRRALYCAPDFGQFRKSGYLRVHMKECRMRKHRTFSPEFKLRVVMEVVTGAKRPSEVCREHHLKDSLLLKWRKQFAENAAQVFARPDGNDEKARIAELERTVGRLAVENEILKKASALMGIDPDVST